MGSPARVSTPCSRCSTRSAVSKDSTMQTRRTAKEAVGRQQLSMMGRLMPTIMRLRRSNKHHRTRERVRRRLHDLTLHPAPTDPPRRRRAGVRIASHQDRGWTIHTVSPTQATAKGTVLYLHGGGWMNEAVIQHWWLIQELAAERSEEHTSELQSRFDLVCRLLLVNDRTR